MRKRELLRSYIQEQGLIQHQIDSFNDFLENKLQSIVDEIGMIKPEIDNYHVRLEEISLGVPSVKEANGAIRQSLPQETRLRDLTYAVPILIKMVPVENDVEQEVTQVKIGEMPVMTQSNICHLCGMNREELFQAGEDPEDPGGYFIVNGTERVLVLVEDLASNKINLERPSTGKFTESARIFSTSGWYRRVNSVSRQKDGSLWVSMPPFSKPIPLAVVLRALGTEKDADIVNLVTSNKELQKDLYVTLEESADISKRDDALDYMGKRVAFGKNQEERVERARSILDRYLLPHMGTDGQNLVGKAHFLGDMAERVLKFHRHEFEIDDKDHYANKRLRLAGELFEDLFRVTFRALVSNTAYSLEKACKRNRKVSLSTAVRSNFLTARLQHAIATGAWVGSQQGVSQHLDRMNYISALSHRRRVRSLLSRTQPHFAARDLHSTHWGRLCPSETPEGSNIGLVKNLALTSYITKYHDDALLEETLGKMGIRLGGGKK